MLILTRQQMEMKDNASHFKQVINHLSVINACHMRNFQFDKKQETVGCLTPILFKSWRFLT